jgi:hypothetical protein
VIMAWRRNLRRSLLRSFPASRSPLWSQIASVHAMAFRAMSAASPAVALSSKERNALTAAAAVTVTAVIIDNEPNGSTLFSFYGFDNQKLSLPASTKLLLVSRAVPSRRSMIARMKYRGSKRATGWPH